MEITTKEYQLEYFKTNIDVLMNWIDFQSSFGKIPGISSFDISPKLYKLKNDILNKVEEYLSKRTNGLNTTVVNQIVTTIIIETLNENDLSQIAPFLLNLKDDKVIEFTNALFIRRSVLKTLSRKENIQIDNNEEIEKIYKEFLDNLRWLKLNASLEHKDYSEALLSVYMESLPINLDNTKTSYAYISEVLFYIKRLERYYKEIAENKGIKISSFEDISEDLNIVQDEIDSYMKFNSFFCLIIIFDIFNGHIETLKNNNLIESNPKTLKLV